MQGLALYPSATRMAKCSAGAGPVPIRNPNGTPQKT